MFNLQKYWDSFINGYVGYGSYLWSEITNPSLTNYFYWLLIVSIFFFFVEVVTPWRKDQPILRKDFWMDFFYMFFNFFLFSLIIYNAASSVIVDLFNDIILYITNFNLQDQNPMKYWPMWAILITGFLVRDFVQWWVHRLLHRFPFLWEFHKVHHSVEEMGFAAHLRYHWMENVVYRTLEYIPLALMGIGLHDFFVIHIFTLAVGHYNHSNITVDGKVTGGVLGFLIGIAMGFSIFDIHLFDSLNLLPKFGVVGICTILGSVLLGPVMKYLFNSPEMHIWHHSYELPEDRQSGINFGLTLAIWDYIFGTAHIPFEGRDIKLGFPEMENYPKDFITQNLHMRKKD